MKKLFERIVNNENETEKIAEEFLKKISSGEIVALKGNLGAGKTFFVKSVGKLLSVNEVNSPTFSLVNNYSGKINLIHFDFYRIKNIAELYDIGIEEYLNNDDAIVFIEWAELFQEVLPREYYLVDITILEDSKRKFEIYKNG